MTKGQIILLNGISSSGKTTVAKQLQGMLPTPHMVVSMDDFFHLYPEKYLSPQREAEAVLLMELVPKVVSGLHGSVGALATAGNNLILDHVLQEEEWLQECVTQWAALDVLFVGLHCPLDIAEQREKERGDRNIGTARYQFDRVHAHGMYDLELDTAVLNPEQCAQQIMALLENKPKETAFQQLATRFAADEAACAY